MSNLSQNSDQSNSIRIKIIGLGGAGSNMINRLKLDDFDTISTIAVNTDAQALANLQCDELIKFFLLLVFLRLLQHKQPLSMFYPYQQPQHQS